MKDRAIAKSPALFMICMVIAMLLVCAFPGIATWLPDKVMGPDLHR